MTFLIIALIVCSFLLGVFFCMAANDRSDPSFYFCIMSFLCMLTIAFGIKAEKTFEELVARQQLLEQKCVQAGIAEMKTVATEERFEFIEALPVPAEKSEP